MVPTHTPPLECQRIYIQSASRLRYRALVPELILLVFLHLGDALYIRLVEAVHLILVATLLLDYTKIQPYPNFNIGRASSG